MSKVKAKYFDEDYWMTPYEKSGYSPQQGYSRDSYLFEASALTLVELYGREGYWLEAGCAFGWLVEQLQDLGVHAEGFDISKYSIKNAPSDIRLMTTCHDGLNCSAYDPNSFDIIYSFETAEHVAAKDVSIWLGNLYLWLKPGGNLLITVCLGHNNLRGIDDIDESHQTLQPRSWWHDKLEGVGFILDAECGSRAKEIVVKTGKMSEPETVMTRYGWHIFTYRRPI